MLFHRYAATILAALILNTPAAHAATSANDDCLSSASIPQKVAAAPFLVFGDVHGTAEVPRFIASYLCAASRNARLLTLAMEIPASEQPGIDTYLASAGKSDDLARFVSSPFWQRSRQDGRTSIAMLHLFEQIRAMRASGTQIRIVAIDDTQAADRNVAMAARIKAELTRSTGHQLVVLIGGLHAIRSKRTQSKFQSSIYLLADEHPLSLIVGTAGGTAWVCKSGDPASCNATNWDINRVNPAPESAITLTPPSEQFDGVFFVGQTTASPPAIAVIKTPFAAEQQ